MALESRQYGDPEKVLMRKQEDAARKHAQCGNCAHKVSGTYRGETHTVCSYAYRTYGVRCKSFLVDIFLKGKT